MPPSGKPGAMRAPRAEKRMVRMSASIFWRGERLCELGKVALPSGATFSLIINYLPCPTIGKPSVDSKEEIPPLSNRKDDGK